MPSPVQGLAWAAQEDILRDIAIFCSHGGMTTHVLPRPRPQSLGT